MPNSKPPFGLIAGAGDLPLFFARQARRQGSRLATVAIRGAASPKIEKLSDEITWLGPGQLGSLLSFFKKRGVVKAVMHGKVEHSQAFKNPRLDFKAIALLARLKDRSGESILKALASELSKVGVRLLDGRHGMADLLPEAGWLTKKKADSNALESIRYGLSLARILAKSGVGQSLLVKKMAVAAVEAMEGTDETILRAGKWAGSGAILIKTASPRQDWRFDIPTVGPTTLENLAKAGARGLVLEAGKSFLLNREEAIRIADKNKIFILAVG